MSNTTNALLDFRVAYLRAVAYSWQDSEYKENMLNAENLLDFLENSKLPNLFYCNPWPLLTIQISELQTLDWQPLLRQGWIGPNDYIEFTLPDRPSVTDGKLAEALTAYYFWFPSILGRQNIPSELPEQSGVTNSFAPSQTYDIGIGGTTFENMAAFMLNVVELSWSNDVFKNELLAAGNDASEVLSKYFGVNNPLNFNMKFRKDNDGVFKYNAKEQEWCVDKNKQPVVVRIWYPQKPDEDAQLSMAIAVYNTKFSCS